MYLAAVVGAVAVGVADDAAAAVRRHLWVEANAPTLRAEATTADSRPSSATLLDMLVEAACYAA